MDCIEFLKQFGFCRGRLVEGEVEGTGCTNGVLN